ncbi:MAG: cell division protein ZapA [bacterium]
MKKTIDVQVLGQNVRIRHEDEEYIRQLESFVNERIRMQEADPKAGSNLQLAIRGLLTIADEYFTAIREKESVRKEVEDKARKLIHFIDQQAALLEEGG